MYADDTSIMNMAHDINDLQYIISIHFGIVEKYFDMKNLIINPTKTHCIFFQTKQCRQDHNHKIPIRNREIKNVST
jgi:hypothetical protein